MLHVARTARLRFGFAGANEDAVENGLDPCGGLDLLDAGSSGGKEALTHGMMNCHTMKGPMVSHEKLPDMLAMSGQVFRHSTGGSERQVTGSGRYPT